eukprot:TRINITY_DN70177_c0_g1_i1.p1 TRINITY_DN70177_c0_g1~~TRINITY_DN70177_c0_g1_i1.p1  ORF type:complete len:1828 (+),score=592.16 TRINITY_DN70177_c0_g1_i1:160-5484(+)
MGSCISWLERKVGLASHEQMLHASRVRALTPADHEALKNELQLAHDAGVFNFSGWQYAQDQLDRRLAGDTASPTNQAGKQWLTVVLQQLWPYIRKWLNSSMEKGGRMETAIIRAWETEKKDVKVQSLEFDIGGESPPIDVHTRTGANGAELIVIIDFHAALKAKLTTLLPIAPELVISDLHFSGELHVWLGPLELQPPFFRFAEVAFCDPPSLNFQVTIGGPGQQFGGVVRHFLINDFTKDLKNEITLPNVLRVPLTAGGFPRSIKKTPQGVLRVCVVRCSNLKAADITGRSDPYVRICIGASEDWQTPHKVQTLHPVWTQNNEHDFILYDSSQVFFVTVFDYDEFGDDDFLGMRHDVPICRLLRLCERQTLRWYLLGAKPGDVRFRRSASGPTIDWVQEHGDSKGSPSSAFQAGLRRDMLVLKVDNDRCREKTPAEMEKLVAGLCGRNSEYIDFDVVCTAEIDLRAEDGSPMYGSKKRQPSTVTVRCEWLETDLDMDQIVADSMSPPLAASPASARRESSPHLLDRRRRSIAPPRLLSQAAHQTGRDPMMPSIVQIYIDELIKVPKKFTDQARDKETPFTIPWWVRIRLRDQGNGRVMQEGTTTRGVGPPTPLTPESLLDIMRGWVACAGQHTREALHAPCPRCSGVEFSSPESKHLHPAVLLPAEQRDKLREILLSQTDRQFCRHKFENELFAWKKFAFKVYADEPGWTAARDCVFKQSVCFVVDVYRFNQVSVELSILGSTSDHPPRPNEEVVVMHCPPQDLKQLVDRCRLDGRISRIPCTDTEGCELRAACWSFPLHRKNRTADDFVRAASNTDECPGLSDDEAAPGRATPRHSALERCMDSGALRLVDYINFLEELEDPRRPRCGDAPQTHWLNMLSELVLGRERNAAAPAKRMIEQLCLSEGQRALQEAVGSATCGAVRARFENVDLGVSYPSLESITVHNTGPHCGARHEARIDVSLKYDGDITVELEFQAFGKRASIGVKNLSMQAEAAIFLRPLQTTPPFFGNVSLTFPNPPHIDMDFTGVADLLDWGAEANGLVQSSWERGPPVHRWTRAALRCAVASKAVMPHSFTLRVGEYNRRESDYDFASLRFPPPAGLLELTLLSARNLEAGDTSPFGNTSDPYVVCRLGAHEWQSPVLSKTCDPDWRGVPGSSHVFFVYDKSAQWLSVEVYDHDLTSADDLLGRGPEQVTVATLLGTDRLWGAAVEGDAGCQPLRLCGDGVVEMVLMRRGEGGRPVPALVDPATHDAVAEPPEGVPRDRCYSTLQLGVRWFGAETAGGPADSRWLLSTFVGHIRFPPPIGVSGWWRLDPDQREALRRADLHVARGWLCGLGGMEDEAALADAVSGESGEHRRTKALKPPPPDVQQAARKRAAYHRSQGPFIVRVLAEEEGSGRMQVAGTTQPGQGWCLWAPAPGPMWAVKGASTAPVLRGIRSAAQEALRTALPPCPFDAVVVTTEGALLRQGPELTSDRARLLPLGERIQVLEVRGRRAHTKDGWLSLVSDSGASLVEWDTAADLHQKALQLHLTAAHMLDVPHDPPCEKCDGSGHCTLDGTLCEGCDGRGVQLPDPDCQWMANVARHRERLMQHERPQWNELVHSFASSPFTRVRFELYSRAVSGEPLACAVAPIEKLRETEMLSMTWSDSTSEELGCTSCPVEMRGPQLCCRCEQVRFSTGLRLPPGGNSPYGALSPDAGSPKAIPPSSGKSWNRWIPSLIATSFRSQPAPPPSPASPPRGGGGTPERKPPSPDVETGLGGGGGGDHRGSWCAVM